MAAAAMKHMSSNFAKLDKFEGVDFRRWQKKMHYLISSMSVVYVLNTPIPDDGDDATNVESSKELWDSLEAKYMAEDTLSKKFLVSNFTNYKMTDSRPVLEQYNEFFGILERFTQHKMNMDESIQDEALDKFEVFKTEVELQQGTQIKRFRTDRGGEYMDTLYFQAFVRLPYPKLKTLGERGIECIFVGYAEHSKAFSGSVVPEKVTEEVVQQPKHELRKIKRNRTPKDFGPEFQLYLIEGTRNEVSDQHSYCFNVEDDPKTFDEAIKSQDVELTKKYLSSRFSMKDMGDADVILVSTLMDISEKLIPNNGQAVSQLEYFRVIGCLMYTITYTRPGIAFAVGKLSRNTEKNSSTSGWVFLLDGGAIFWAFKKQTCIIGSTMKSEFVALAAVGKEAECSTTLAKAYIQMYNGKSRHLGVRHSMIRELITNGVISIEFVRSQQNLADHLTKRLTRDLVINSAEGMRLKSN
nr:zinc finger, CCHC-type [Tanacetum cinerariifolium]